MVIENVVKTLIDVIEHVHHFHGRAVFADSGETYNVTEVDCNFLIQFGFHNAFLLQRLYH